MALQRIIRELTFLLRGNHLVIKKWISGAFIGAYIGAIAIAATLPVQTSEAATAEAMPIKVAVRRITETQ